MANCCRLCAGSGVTRSDNGNGGTIAELCYRCDGSGGHDELDIGPSRYARAFLDNPIAEQNRAAKRKLLEEAQAQAAKMEGDRACG